MKIDLTNDEIGVLTALIFEHLNTIEVERWFEGMDEEKREKARYSFRNIKSKILAANFMVMADIIKKEKEDADE
ncbi:hypothetical protein K8P03_11060 [Anaerococcus murdochii]|uniref:Phage protein n=1 Tax=Anaerococcus murdochii TaxID=411577 RepID=A0ABS7SW69_9FIRM|nr:hypothetical protein [Anaerococcus murdochii]MBZ2385785.1 hypothetical protein [Anaerococcus murdochii]MBZ2387811.1 hypothetical protein [Anaerococcus murdochii]